MPVSPANYLDSDDSSNPATFNADWMVVRRRIRKYLEDQEEMQKKVQAQEEEMAAAAARARPHNVIFCVSAAHARHKPSSRLYLCGNVPALGNWVPSEGVEMHTGPDTFPLFSCSLHLEATAQVHYRYVLVDAESVGVGAGRVASEPTPEHNSPVFSFLDSDSAEGQGGGDWAFASAPHTGRPPPPANTAGQQMRGVQRERPTHLQTSEDRSRTRRAYADTKLDDTDECSSHDSSGAHAERMPPPMEERARADTGPGVQWEGITRTLDVQLLVAEEGHECMRVLDTFVEDRHRFPRLSHHAYQMTAEEWARYFKHHIEHDPHGKQGGRVAVHLPHHPSPGHVHHKAHFPQTNAARKGGGDGRGTGGFSGEGSVGVGNVGQLVNSGGSSLTPQQQLQLRALPGGGVARR